MIGILAAILSTFVLASTAAADSIVGWGTNGHGELGGGYRSPFSSLPVSVTGLSGIKQVVSTYKSGFALLEDGTIRAWGDNAFGQLGDGTTVEKDVPTPVKRLSSVRSVAIGGIASLGAHTLALLNDGTVMVTGDNKHGQLGLGNTTDRLVPVSVPGLSHVTAVSASASHSLALLSNGTVKAWGSDDHGELGAPAREACGTAACSRSPRSVGLPSVSAISAGWRFSL